MNVNEDNHNIDEGSDSLKLVFSEMRLKDWRNLLADMATSTWFFRCDLVRFGKNLLSMFYGRIVWQWDSSEILKQCAKDKWLEGKQFCDIESFFKQILKTYLWLEELPHDEYFNLLERTREMVRVLVHRQDEYKKRISDVSAKAHRTGEEEYQLRLTKYYLKQVELTLQDISEYLSDQIEMDALTRCGCAARGVCGWSRIDLFEHRVRMADMNLCNDIDNKFLDYPVPCVITLRKVYGKKPMRFYSWAEKELSEKLIPVTLELIKSNHVLNARKDILRQGIKLYKKGDYQVANSVLTLQIEGLIRDVLISLGEDEESLYATSLTEKAERLEGQKTGFYAYEYYAFRFPVFRNKIAHGDAHNSQREDAIKVMLDFCSLCRHIATDDKVPINKLVELAKKLTNKKSDFDEVIEYARYSISHQDVSIPDFYGLGTKERIAQRKIRQQGFWDALLEDNLKAEKPIHEAVAEGMKIAKKFCNAQYAEKYKNEYILKMGSKEEERKKMIESLRSMFSSHGSDMT